MATSTIKGAGVLHIETTAGSGTVNAGANGSINITIPQVTGYIPIGIIGIQNSHGANLVITTFYISSTTNAVVVVRNVGSSSATVTVTPKILYARTGFYS